MQFYLSILIGILIIIIAILALRLYLMQKSAREIRQEFAKRLQTDTNALIGISSRSRSSGISLSKGISRLRKALPIFHTTSGRR